MYIIKCLLKESSIKYYLMSYLFHCLYRQIETDGFIYLFSEQKHHVQDTYFMKWYIDSTYEL